MKLLVTGRKGQVAVSLRERAATFPDIELIMLGRPELDLGDPHMIAPAIAAHRPDIIVSAAAYTAVDQAEDEAEWAFAINTTGAGLIAVAAANLNIPVIHLSTDYVFDGDAAGTYTEDDPTGPRCVYGASKLGGELAVKMANPHHIILRTAWVYSPFGKNFARTMLRLADSRKEVAVVSDQWGNPTSALDIADAILHVATVLRDDPRFSAFGVYHLVGTGATNWSGFARRIFEASMQTGGPCAQVRDIVTADYPTRARRPLNSRLATDKFAAFFGGTMPDWRQSTAHVVARLVGGPTESPGQQ